MHRKLTGDIALVPQILDHRTGICAALKQNGFPILENAYALELLQANLQTLESIQRCSDCMPTIPREELDAVVVAILDLRPRLAKLKFRRRSPRKVILLTILEMSDSAATSTTNWTFGCTNVTHLEVELANAGLEGPKISVPFDK